MTVPLTLTAPVEGSTESVWLARQITPFTKSRRELVGAWKPMMSPFATSEVYRRTSSMDPLENIGVIPAPSTVKRSTTTVVGVCVASPPPEHAPSASKKSGKPYLHMGRPESSTQRAVSCPDTLSSEVNGGRS